ncbi:hypothetical protein MYXO_00146 [Myxococcaceae bacterium]|nr:hypothetical protein MYXO_00146 [Myxococcaceae bacterium]
MRAGRLAVALGVSLMLGCSSMRPPGWLWPFGGESAAAPDAAPAVATPRVPPPPVSTPLTPPNAPISETGDAAILGFQERAETFYGRLTQRRFNTLATYNDPTLRAFFETPEGYADYYARLAQDLEKAHFEKNRPLVAEVHEFALEAPGRARVKYRLEGKNARPLRFWSTSIEREDVWQQANGRWWIVPGKL